MAGLAGSAVRGWSDATAPGKVGTTVQETVTMKTLNIEEGSEMKQAYVQNDSRGE